MSEPTRTGCGLWLSIVVIVSLMIATFTGVTAPVYDVTTPTPENLGFVTVIPQSADAYFVVENNQVNYASFPTLGNPCYYLISGYVLDLNGEPFTDYVVNLMTAPANEEVLPEGPGYSFPGDGSFPEDGPSGYSTLLPNWQVNYELWMTNELGGEALSSHVIVPTMDCDRNRAIVNFVQVRPLP
jgi:hypothetical protein